MSGKKIITYVRPDKTLAIDQADPPGCLARVEAAVTKVGGYVAVAGVSFLVGYVLGYVK